MLQSVKWGEYTLGDLFEAESYTKGFDANKVTVKERGRIVLPVKNKQPDYDIMETIISAIHKLVVREVVLYADRKSRAVRKVITDNG